MRDITSWRAPDGDFADEWNQHMAGIHQAFVRKREFQTLCDAELGLTCLTLLCPKEPARIMPGLLSGHLAPPPSVDPDGCAAKARQYLLRRRSRDNWHELLVDYMTLDRGIRLYEVHTELDGRRSRHGRIETLVPGIGTERAEFYRKVLRTPPPHRPSLPVALPETPYTLQMRSADERKVEVVFPIELIQNTSSPKPKPLRKVLHRSPRVIKWQDLLVTAEWMDHRENELGVDQPNFWHRRLQSVRFMDRAGELELDGLRLDGIHHCVGMVSTGKTTLLNVLAVHLAQQELRVLMILADRADICRHATRFCRMGIQAVPVLGTSNPQSHHETLMSASGAGIDLDDMESLEWTSPVCYVDAMTEGKLDFNERPCHSLWGKGTDGRDRLHACPLMPVCPSQRARNEMSSALIWVATMPSLLHTRAPDQSYVESVRMLEAATRDRDVILGDETDNLQIFTDDAFSQDFELVSSSDSSGRLNEMGRQVLPEALEGRSRAEYAMQLHDWLSPNHNAQRAMDLIVGWGADPEKGIGKWLSRLDWLTPERLINDLVQDMARHVLQSINFTEPTIEILKKVGWNNRVVDVFLFRNPASPGDIDDDLKGVDKSTMYELRELVRDVLSMDFAEMTMTRAQNWIVTQEKQMATKAGVQPLDADNDEVKAKRSQLARRLVVAAALAVLDYNIRSMVRRRHLPAGMLDRPEDEYDLLPRNLPRDYEALVPAFPPGNLIGFRWKGGLDMLPDRHQAHEPAGLNVVNFSGLGRWLLMHLHDWLQSLDGQPGPHVFLTSGSSWAPGSTRYHISREPDSVLALPKELQMRIAESKSRFEPVVGDDGLPIRLSGVSNSHDRIDNLRSMVRAIADPGYDMLESAPSQLELELKALRQDDKARQKHQRIMLITNSYYQTEAAVRVMCEYPQWQGRVAALVQDGSAGGIAPGGYMRLPRSQVHRFGQKDLRAMDILVAPLMAIERGHNIVHTDGKAAIGAVWFLYRPLPVPHDLTPIVHTINSRAMLTQRRGYEDGTQWSLPDWPLQPNPYELDKSLRDFRRGAMESWRSLLRMPGYYRSLPADMRTELVWTLIVMLWQTAGRCVRGGLPVRVRFCDAAFVPAGDNGPVHSLLVDMKQELKRLLNDSDPIRQSLFRSLYGCWYNMLPSPEELEW